MQPNRWSDDAFLDELRRHADSLADDTVARLEREGEVGAVDRDFVFWRTGEEQLPVDGPPPFREFVAATSGPFDDHDPEQVERGGAVFFRHAFSASVVLLLASLPAGYSAPCLSRILSISGDLGRHPYARLMGVLQLLVDISQTRAFEPGGAATVSAQKMRLLHAGIRGLVPRYRPEYAERFGPPVNHEDMLATIMGFSYLVIDGLRTLGAGLRPDEEEDFYALWRAFAVRVGIHPPGSPGDGRWVPATIEEAGIFYAAYSRRHYVGAEDNPDGVELARINLRMVEDLLPGWSRWLGLGGLPRKVMTRLLGAEGVARVGIAPSGDLGPVVPFILRCVQRLSDDAPDHLGERLGRLVFQGMIDRDRGGEVTFLIPDSLAAARELA